MANELRMAGRQLFRASLVPRAPLVIPRIAFPHARAISTTPPRPRLTTRSKPTKPADETISAAPVDLSANRFSPSTAASRSAASDRVYDATSPGAFDLSKILSEEGDEFMRKHYQRTKVELRMKPVLGRTVHLTQKNDLADSLRMLQSFVMKNKIKFFDRHQRMHERPGLKRKRLKSERWRKKFKTGFVATVKRVQELANQGW